MYKTIIFSLLIIVVINYILHFLKNSFTEPIIKYIPDKSKQTILEFPDMKEELSSFLMTINI